MKPKGPFRYIKDNDTGDPGIVAADGSIYEAEFPLADDGTPGGEQKLRVTVITHGGEGPEVKLEVISFSGKHLVAETEGNFSNVARMLYGAARTVTTQVLQPL